MGHYFADLHLHTALSPCGDLLMTPQNIIDRALDLGLDIIAITDHNSAENVKVTVELARDTSLWVIPGMEVESREEVHLICLFPTVEQVLIWQKLVYEALPDLKNKEELFGPQIVTDLEDKYIRKVERLLATATSFQVEEIVDKVKEIGGIVIPSHVDKKKYSLLANLGFIPPNLQIAAVEISTNITEKEARDKFPDLSNYSLISSSDAHYLQEIKKMMEFKLEKLNFKELVWALKGENKAILK